MGFDFTYCRRIALHYEQIWANKAEEHRWTLGPTYELPQRFCVLEFHPSPQRQMWTYATCCMSQPDDAAQIEVHMFSPFKAELHIELLTALAHYHRTGRRIGLGDTVNFGRPWLPKSKCGFGLISLPFLDGPRLEVLEDPAIALNVRCYWLLPITESELLYKERHGIDAIENKLEEAEVDYLNPYRASVV